jgi:hypothetical protein
LASSGVPTSAAGMSADDQAGKQARPEQELGMVPGLLTFISILGRRVGETVTGHGDERTLARWRVETVRACLSPRYTVPSPLPTTTLPLRLRLAPAS